MTFVESSMVAIHKARKSRQYLVSRQNSLCWGSFLSEKTLTFRVPPVLRYLNICHPDPVQDILDSKSQQRSQEKLCWMGEWLGAMKLAVFGESWISNKLSLGTPPIHTN